MDSTELTTLIESSIKKALQTEEFIKLITQAVVKTVTENVLKELKEALDFNIEKIHVVEKEIKTLESRLECIESDFSATVNELEQYTRKNSVRIFGVVETEKEVTKHVAVNFIKEKLGVTLQPFDIDNCHRVGRGGSKDRPRGIILKLTSHEKKVDILKNRKNLKGTKFVVKEDLTRQNQDLLQSAGKKYGFKEVWSRDGKIFTKTSTGRTRQIRRLSDIS